MQAAALGCLAPSGGAACWPLTSRLRISCGSRGGRRGPFFQTLWPGVKGPLRASLRGEKERSWRSLLQQPEVGGGKDASSLSGGGSITGTETSSPNDRARAMLLPPPCSRLSKPFFISWHLFLRALWHSLPKPKAATPGLGCCPGGSRATACRRRVQLQSPALLTLSKLNPAAGIGVHPEIKKLDCCLGWTFP